MYKWKDERMNVGTDLVDAGVLVAPVLAVKPIVAGIVVRHASAGSLLYGKIPPLKEHDVV